MNYPSSISRRAALASVTSAGAALLSSSRSQTLAAPSARREGPIRIGVISAAIHGKPQPRNGHTWHFAQYLHPEFNWAAMKKHYAQAHPSFERVYRNPNFNFSGQLPFPNTRIAAYYDPDTAAAQAFAEVFPGVEVARSLDELVNRVDAIWMGDASGFGEDHFELVAPGLQKGLPTFCDKPIGGTVDGTKKILDLAQNRKAPLMSSSIFRYEFGMEAALRMRDSGEFGPIEFITATLHSRYKLESWMIYGQHPVWSVMTLMGAGAEAVCMIEHKDTCHALITWPDRYPTHVWYGEPFEKFEYNRTSIHFKKKPYTFTPSIEGNFEYGHHYEMFRMAAAFREMVITGQEPVPHQEILEVTAIVHAGARSLSEGNRFVKLAEVMP